MLKFGELVSAERPVFVHFYGKNNENSNFMDSVIGDLATAGADYLTVVKIDVDKNPELVDTLRIKALPTMLLYKNGAMIWRQTGLMDLNTLISVTQTL